MKRGTTRPPLARMARIHNLLNAGRAVTAVKVARELEVSPKTIARDLEYMRESLELPLEYEASEHTFRYRRPVASMLFEPYVSEVSTQEVRKARPAMASIESNPSQLEIEHTDDLAAICARYGVEAEHVLRSMLREAFMDALDNPRLMDNIVRGARALAVEWKGGE